ncbi:hypothetical protein ACFWZ3_16610 [Frateuria sp. GZRR35]|uniref:hypothetical protein n=1 Tax=Frateuria sp. GZRR35 TaxID=3351536 RepID=UPI003EDBC897
MKPLLVLTLLAMTTLWQAEAMASPDPLCGLLRRFVASVGPRETRSIEFHTSWGQNFKGSSTPAFLAKRCVSHDYGPADVVCVHLMSYGMIEFSGNNAEQALACLSEGTQFGLHVQLARAEFSFPYGTDERGTNITIKYDEDRDMGGMVLTITADGY